MIIASFFKADDTNPVLLNDHELKKYIKKEKKIHSFWGFLFGAEISLIITYAVMNN